MSEVAEMSDTEMKELAAKVHEAVDSAKVKANPSIEAAKATQALKDAITAHSSQRDQFTLDEMGVDTFTAVSSYENNRDVIERAAKQAKGKGPHHTSAIVAIAMLDRKENKALWERTEKENPINTLPFIKLDGHTRAYGWTTPIKEGEPKTLFERPECLSITVYRNQSDEQIHEIVKNYCDGVNKANNVELQQMATKKAEFEPQTNFVRKDSWKTAFRTVNSKYGKDLDLAFADFKDQMQAIDDLNVDTTYSEKKLSGVRAALITTYSADEKEKWVAFWSEFYNKDTKEKAFTSLFAKLKAIHPGKAKEAKEQCEKTFKKYQE